MKMILADMPPSDSWVSYCPFRGLSFILYHLMACDSQNGFPRGSSGDTQMEGEGRRGDLQQGSPLLSYSGDTEAPW